MNGNIHSKKMMNEEEMEEDNIDIETSCLPALSERDPLAR
jgi:hypothetical protein